MEEMFTNLILLTIALGGAKILLFHVTGKAKYEMSATKNIKDNSNVIALDHYKYIYSQEELYNSMYANVRNKFKDAIKSGILTSEQIWFIEKYLRNVLNDNRKGFKNNAHCIYTLLASSQLNNSHYSYLNQVLDDFINH